MLSTRPPTLLATTADLLVLAIVLLLTTGHTAAQSSQPPLASTAAAIDCPSQCSCFVVNSTHHHRYNHAECTSLAGLAQHRRNGDIHTVDLSHIGLERLGHQLDKFDNLSHIVLSHNRLAEVPALTHALRLRGLYLDFNRITSGKLNAIPASVQHLNLSHNHLTHLPAEALRRLHRLQRLQLAGNPINCTCETLQSRDWLRERHVSVDDVRCAAPSAVKGMSWLLLSENETCADERAWNIWSDADNGLMYGDQVIDESEADGRAVDDEFERDFIPIERKRLAKRQLEADEDDAGEGGSGDDGAAEDELSEDVVLETAAEPAPRLAANETATVEDDGSGDSKPLSSGVRLAEFTSVEPEEHDDDDGADEDGSGSGVAIVGRIGNETAADVGDDDDDDDETTTVDEDLLDPNFTPPTLGIFVHKFNETDAPLEADVSDEDTATDDAVVDSAADVDEDAAQPIGRTVDAAGTRHEVTADEKETAESTYIVLVMLAILLLGLIVFVAIRRKNAARRNRTLTNANDAENGNAKELVNMNRSHPGKPRAAGNGNGAEVLPLIGARDKWDSRIQPANGLSKPDQEELRRAQEPLLQRLDGVDPDSASPPAEAAAPAATAAAEPTAERPQPLPRTHGAAKRPGSRASSDDGAAPTETNNNVADQIDHPTAAAAASAANTGADDQPQVFQPISPKPARYSPVYSPETGRVKIKLAETQRPRTPMLVTRSRSNAGEIVSTPVRPPK